MTTVNTKSGKVIKVVSREEEKNTLTVSDSEMDARATEAVKAAINKAKICKKPMLLVLAGPNGSGKSTITTFLTKLVNTRMWMILLLQQVWIIWKQPYW